MTLVHQLMLATLVVGTTVIVHLVGLAILLAVLRRYRRAERRILIVLLNGAAILVAAFGLFALHSVEIWIWAGVFQWLGAFADFEHALYFSTSTYVTIGYGDIVLPLEWRLLSAMNAANGFLNIGIISTITLEALRRVRKMQLDGPGD